MIDSEIKRRNHKVGIELTKILSLLFLLGFVIDAIFFKVDNLIIDFWLDIISSCLLASCFILTIVNKNKWDTWLFMLSAVYTIHMILSALTPVIFNNEINYELKLMFNMLCGVVVVVFSAFILKPMISYIYSAIYIIFYIVITLIYPSDFLIKSISVVTIIYFGLSRLLTTLMARYKSATEEALLANKGLVRLKESIAKERAEIKSIIENLSIKAKGRMTKNDLIQLEKIVNNSITDTVFNYIESKGNASNDFFTALIKSYPNLTDSELNMAYMIYNGLSTKEIAAQRHCTVDSIKVFRSRLRKKLMLKPEQNLWAFLNSCFLKSLKVTSKN